MNGVPRSGWFALLFGMLGVRVPSFALAVWVFQRTGSAASYSWALTWTVLPAILLSPFAGLAADRLGGRVVSVLALACASLGCALVLVEESTRAAAVWPLHIALASCAASLSLTHSAFHASLAAWSPQHELIRSNGTLQVLVAVCELAGPLVVWIAPAHSLSVWLWSGLAALALAACALLVVPFPPAGDPAARGGPKRWFADLKQGLVFVWSARPLRALLFFVCTMHLGMAMGTALIAPHVLERASLQALGGSMLLYGAGMTLGGGLLIAWGGARRKGRGLPLLGVLAGGTLCAAGLGRGLLWEAAVFAAGCATPMLVGSAHAVFQASAPGALQGRVFGLRATAIRLCAASGYLLAGWLLERMTTGASPGGESLPFASDDPSGLLLVAVGGAMGLTATTFFFNANFRALDGLFDLPPEIASPLGQETGA